MTDDEKSSIDTYIDTYIDKTLKDIEASVRAFDEEFELQGTLDLVKSLNNPLGDQVLLKLVDKYPSVKPAFIADFVKSYVGNTSRNDRDSRMMFGRISEAAGLDDLAIEIYRNIGHLSSAAVINERRGNFSEALKDYLANKRFEEAGDVYRKLGRRSLAVDCYKAARKFEKAAETAEEAGLEKEARKLWLKVMEKTSYIKAGQIAEKLVLLEKAYSFYCKAGESFNHELCAEAEKSKRRILEQVNPKIGLKFMRKYYYSAESIAKYALEHGKPDEAIKTYVKEDRFEEAADVAKEAGLVDRAQKLYQKEMKKVSKGHIGEGHKLSQMARIARKAGFPDADEFYHDAMEWFERRGSFRYAGEVAEEAGWYNKAVTLYEQGGVLGKAIIAAKAGGMTGKADELREKSIMVDHILNPR